METVLVTGATGAVGSHVARSLLARGDRPVGYDLSDSFAFARDIEGRFEFVKGDLLDLPRLLETAKTFGVESVIHTGALLPDLARANPYQAIQVNIVGTANVVEMVMLLGLRRMVFTSTKGTLADFIGEHGPPGYLPVNEDRAVIQPDNNHTLYNDTKVFCEHYLHKAIQMWGLDIVILRFSTIYGPGRIRHGARALLGEMIENAVRGRPTRLPKGGDQRDDFVYLKDVAGGCIAACFAGDVRHRTFHIGSGALVSYYEAAAAIQELLPRATIEIGPGLDPMGLGFRTSGLLDIGRAQAELGYKPQYSLPDGVRDYVTTMKVLGLE